MPIDVVHPTYVKYEYHREIPLKWDNRGGCVFLGVLQNSRDAKAERAIRFAAAQPEIPIYPRRGFADWTAGQDRAACWPTSCSGMCWVQVPSDARC